jgi:hypothetical protein
VFLAYWTNAVLCSSGNFGLIFGFYFGDDHILDVLFNFALSMVFVAFVSGQIANKVNEFQLWVFETAVPHIFSIAESKLSSLIEFDILSSLLSKATTACFRAIIWGSKAAIRALAKAAWSGVVTITSTAVSVFHQLRGKKHGPSSEPRAYPSHDHPRYQQPRARHLATSTVYPEQQPLRRSPRLAAKSRSVVS